MKRSEINKAMREAVAMMKEHHFNPPPFAFWTPEEWQEKGHEYDEIRDCMLGWDITDFGHGDFTKVGLLLITIRNGRRGTDKYTKPYAEKLLIVKDNQHTPMHFHHYKMEDIINRGGGNLMMKLYNADENDGLADTDVEIVKDGCILKIPAGSVISIAPGESVTYPQRLYHEFWGDGDVLVGEVSMTNDDNIDNRFYDQKPRFPEVEEDEAPLYLMFSEYPEAK